METLVIQSRTKSNVRFLTTIARKLGDKVIDNTLKNDIIETHFASERILARDWLLPDEDKVWENL